MKTSPSRFLLIAYLSCFFSALAAHATLIQINWTGRGSNNNWTTAANWQGNTAPSNDGLSQITFGSGQKNYSTVNTNWNVYSLTFNNGDFSLQAPSDSTKVLTLQNGLTFTPSNNDSHLRIGGDYNAGTLNLVLAANQTWTLSSGATEIASDISGAASFTKNGDGRLRLTGNNSYTGGTTINAGTIEVGSNTAFGTGTLTFAADSGTNANARPTLRVTDDDRTLTNNLVLNGAFRVDGGDNLVIGGTVTLNQSTTINLSETFVTFAGGTSGSGSQLTLNGDGTLYLKGVNTYTGGTVVNEGALIFDNAAAVPASGTLRANAEGYIGYGSATNFQTSFLDQFDKANTSGTIGVDSEPTAITPITITTNISLAGFGTTARLGSATKGAISGTITPQGTDYRFGGGGGFLQVSSALVDVSGNSAVRVDSPTETPLTLRLTNTGNSFSGGLYVNQSAVRFADGALPTQIVGNNWVLGTGGYIGTEGINSSGSDSAPTQTSAITTFLQRFSPTSTVGLIGFDNVPGDSTTRAISGDINLSGFTAANPSLYLSTTSNVALSGAITLPTNQTAYRFAAYKGATLNVLSTLSGNHSVILGDPDVLATIGDPRTQQLSTVTLSGNNTYTGGTTLYPGILKLGGAADNTTNALGTGALTIAPTNIDFGEGNGPESVLMAGSNNLTLPNAIVLNSALQIDGSNSLTLAGAISGASGLAIGSDDNRGAATLTLSGNNTYSGGTRVQIFDGQTTRLNVTSNNALGTGELSFRGDQTSDSSGAVGEVHFTSSAPVVYGLSGNNQFSDIGLHLATYTTLTINQANDTQFVGRFYGDSMTGLTKTGAGTLYLNSDSSSSYDGTVSINAGTIIAGANHALGNGTITLNGGTLGVANNVHLDNSLNLVSGRLVGSGQFTTTDPIPQIGTGLTLAPGFSGQGNIGSLQFYELTLAGGGTYEWNLQTFGTPSSASHDEISVSLPSTLSLSGINLLDPADSAHRFTLKAISLQSDGTPGMATGFDPLQTYSWTIFSFNSLSGFDPAKILIDPSAFSTNLGSGAGAGTFSVSQVNNTLVLNFTAVPEPSTYALLAVGLGFVGLTLWRKRRV